MNVQTKVNISFKEVFGALLKKDDIINLIEESYFIGIIEDRIFNGGSSSISFDEARSKMNSQYEGLMIFALSLNRQPSRYEISELTRIVNRTSKFMPVSLILKYNEDGQTFISISISERFRYLQKWREGEKIGKVIILKDINVDEPHTGHLKILQDLKISPEVRTFDELHKQWLDVLDTSILNKKFYQELSNWYFWAMDKVKFPDDREKRDDIRNSTNLIRLITRIIFIWFIKEKKLVPDVLFNKDYLSDIIKDFNKDEKSHNYYNAILQNLFFATLNQKIEERKFAIEGNFNQNRLQYGVKNLYRYAELFKIPEEKVLELFKNIPFLNGGLFDCLDKPDENSKIIYEDGFSRNPQKRSIIPDYLFFEEEAEADLNKYYDPNTKSKRKSKVRGLINILKSYKFTVAESTPIYEEVALDPELLGRVFENLLASYNPETSTTARKATGSYYTPREIVDYMVESSLLEHLKLKLPEIPEEKIIKLVTFSEENPEFTEEEKRKLIQTIDEIKIIDPACGSGAFPMGILHRLVYMLQKLDPDNREWKEIQKIKALLETEEAFNIGDKYARQKRLEEISSVFENNASDYGRKLFLIENCIYGVDIQPIAVQIAKLRFFISLIIDQKVDPEKENFGIRSLPNLETNFVAANTLIGINHTIVDVLKNEMIFKKEEKLRDLRHKYFSASTRREKLELQRKDKQIRKEIAEILIRDGFTGTIAEKLADFDPFDQTKSSDWFDTEWMFGVRDGFDIVIGNPPYIQLQKAFNKKIKYADIYKDQPFKTFDRTGDIYCLFYEKGMEILKELGHLCYISSNKWMRAGYGIRLREFFKDYNPKILIDLGPAVFENATVDTNILLIQKNENQNKLKAVTIKEKKKDKIDFSEVLKNNGVILNKLNKDAWFIGSDAEQRLKEKIERIGKPLKDWDVKIYRGVLTGLNEAFIIDSKKREEILANCKDEDERKRTEAIIKPILRGRDIKRYYYEWAGLWVIGTFPALQLDIEDYPALKKYFLDHFDIRQLEQSGKKYPNLGFDARKKTGNKWFETQDQIAYYHEFEKEKVVWGNISYDSQFCFVDRGIFINAPANLIVSDSVNIKYLIGVMNSKIFNKEFKKVGIFLGHAYEWKKQYVEQVRIPPFTPANQPIINQIEGLVDKIIEAKRQDKNTDTSQWEREIDRLVYQLYDLNEEEIKIIERGRDE